MHSTNRFNKFRLELFVKKTVSILIFILSCNSHDKRPLVGETAHQQRLNAQFKDATKSPLKKVDLRNFKGLNFFPLDSSYIVSAKLLRTSKPSLLEIATSDNKISYYRDFGRLTFTLKGEEQGLIAYQSLEEYERSGYEGRLFLPFTDLTTGKGSYSGGRYIDLLESDIQKDGTIVINFNQSYNPYCAYNEEYSCPIPPRTNHLTIAVKAGIKDF